MTLLITGGTGFVMSVLARRWLDCDRTQRAVVLDAAPLDGAARRYFEPASDRLSVLVADLTQPSTWQDGLARSDITEIVHGATITPISRGTAAEGRREPEADDPRRILDVNIMGTVAMLDWARTLPGLRRFIYVSSGAVYKHDGPDRPGEPLPEDGYVMPRRLYGISKLASELITERYAELFGLSTVCVRPSSVFGTMDRVTSSRNFRHVPNRIAHMAVAGVRCVKVSSLQAIGDYIHAEDVADAIIALLHASSLRHSVYNIAAGQTSSVADLVGWAAEKFPGFTARIDPTEGADIVADPALRSGMWGAYDISRIFSETGWRPRPVREALHAYMDWIAAQRTVSHAEGPA